MAGDWIKMRGNLWDDPRVSKLCDVTDQPEAMIVGALFWLWATADQHTEDGLLPGLTLRQIDRKTGVQGFGEALCGIGWLADHPDGVRIVNFDEHNGASAKRRCTDAQRKANSRGVSADDADKPRTDGGQKTPKLGARERVRVREEKKEIQDSGTPTGIAARAARKAPKSWNPPDANPDPGGELDKFRDHTFRIAIVDWDGCWRNWLRRAADMRPRPRASPGEPEWRAEQRATVAAYAGPAAAKRTAEIIDMEPASANSRLVG